MEIAKKITLLFAILSAIIISLLSGFVWYFANDFAFEDFYKRLEARVNIAAQIKFNENINKSVYAEVRNQYLEKLPSEKQFIFQKTTGANYNDSTRFHIPISFYNNLKANKIGRYRKDNHFYAGRIFQNNNKEYLVIVTADDPIGFRELKELQKILIIGFFLSVIFSFVVGWKFSNYMLTPLRNIIKSVKKIKAENLHLRLDVKKGSDEMSQLAETFNNMLNRLETAFETQNNFISNASHELRTPLTIITSEAELALKVQDADKKTAALLKINEEAERLEHILTSLLGLAQSGFNGRSQPWEEVRMDELLWEIKDAVHQVHPESQIELDLDRLPEDEAQLKLRAIRQLIKLAITNVVANACKYSSYKTVVVRIETDRNRMVITIIDQGIGIPQNDIQHIFEPFYRASNTGSFKGYGIGLPLSLNIIRLHRGTIGIKSQEQVGTEIRISLPLK